MEQLPVPLWVLIPCAAAILYLGYRRWQRKPERVLKPGRLWLFPTLLTAVILPLLYLQPHRPFGAIDYAIFLTALSLGAATGFIRARATRIRYDHERGELMAGFSLSALLLLIPIGFARHISREYLGIGPSAVSHGDARAITGSLLFVLAMIIVHRLTLWLRTRDHMPKKD
ncbi:MAG: hypothetical protein R3E11_13195 [Sphingobium sp.]|nr:hypothetical protein [Sphingobium sp.]MCP5399354.1 hypothetical protein [Sphingomonas sp.]